MNKFGAVGCIGAIAIVVIVLVGISTTSLGPYLVGLAYMFGAILSAPFVSSPLWYDTEAKVVDMTMRSHAVYGSYGRMTLDYPDEAGRPHRRIVRVYSKGGALHTVAIGHKLPIKLCKHDPTLLSSARVTIVDDRTCAAPLTAPAVP